MKNYISLFSALWILLLCNGCGTINNNVSNPAETTPRAPEYNEASSWVFQSPAPQKPVDVFYVYPTIYTEKLPANMDIDNPSLRQIATHLIDSQAGVYKTAANIFAPYYRQVSMAQLNPDEDMYQNRYFKIGYEDVSRAFKYYLEHLNEGRPFILAGHSQGSMVLINLIRDQFNNPRLQKKLVAAYLIGYSLTEADFKNYPWMKPATGSTDTGVVISYNTQAPGTTDSPVLLPGAFCINPLNWKTDETPADKSLNLGAVFLNKKTSDIEREIPYYAGAQIDQKTGALVTTLPEELDVGGFPSGVYHKYDYTLWYRNLQSNVEVRCDGYLKKTVH